MELLIIYVFLLKLIKNIIYSLLIYIFFNRNFLFRQSREILKTIKISTKTVSIRIIVVLTIIY